MDMSRRFNNFLLRLLAVLAAFTVAEAQCIVPESSIVGGGPGKDGIPALTTPDVVSAEEGDSFLLSADLVLGVVVNGEARAYPHAVLWWHEIVNDILGGKPIAVTFCPLTGSGLVYDPVIGDRTLNFGTSGLLFDNNLIMFDRQTDTLWSQMMRVGICGPLIETEPSFYPVVQSTWAGWKNLHPTTTVVSFNTGFSRNYSRYPYGSYDEVDNTQALFPHSFIDTRLPMKEVVLGITNEGLARAYPMSTLGSLGSRVAVNDVVNGRPVLVVYDRDSAVALPFERRLIDPTIPEGSEGPEGPEGMGGMVLSFDVVDGGVFPFELRDGETGTIWNLTGLALDGPLAGSRLQPIATSYAAMWFAWASFNAGTEIHSTGLPPADPSTSAQLR